ncbi:MAG: hypothetical protein ACLTMP_05975 [Eggerthella lenta]
MCLQNAIAFGVVATLMTWVIYPALEQLLSKVPGRHNIAFIAVTVGFCILIFLYYVNVASRPRRADDAGSSDATSIELSYSYDSEAAG